VIPIPFKVNVTGFLSGSLEGIFELLEKMPAEVGENWYVTVQLALGDKVSPEQLSVILLKGRDGGVMVPMMRLALPSFLTVTCLSEVLPTITSPKLKEVGLT
jgi:hypothetical protein